MKLVVSTLLTSLISVGNSIAEFSDSTKSVVAFPNATKIDCTGSVGMEGVKVRVIEVGS